MDTNGDGAITDDDKVMIGDPNPDFQANLSLNFGYKGFDLSLQLWVSLVIRLLNLIARLPITSAETITDIFERWHGEGTSNRFKTNKR